MPNFVGRFVAPLSRFARVGSTSDARLLSVPAIRPVSAIAGRTVWLRSSMIFHGAPKARSFTISLKWLAKSPSSAAQS